MDLRNLYISIDLQSLNKSTIKFESDPVWPKIWLNVSCTHLQEAYNKSFFLTAINCTAKLKRSQRTIPKREIQPSPCPVGSRSINSEPRHAAAPQMCEFWFCGRSAVRLSSPAVRIFTRPQGQVRDHTDHKTQLHKHCQRAWLQQRMGRHTEPTTGG